MQRTIMVVAFFLCMTVTGLSNPALAESPEDVIKTWVATFNENNPKKLLDFYEKSDQIEVIVSDGVRYRGIRKLEEAYLDTQKQIQFSDSNPHKMTARVLGDTAIITFQHRFKFKVLEDNSRWQVQVQTTSVLHQSHGQWKIVHEHSSAIKDVERITPVEN